MTIKPPVRKRVYTQEIGGFFGTFGTGAECQIFFLQVGLRPAELDRLTLISDIPGAETWSVQDLFQREVAVILSRKGIKIKESPILFIERSKGRSKMSAGIMIEGIFLVGRLFSRRIKQAVSGMNNKN